MLTIEPLHPDGKWLTVHTNPELPTIPQVIQSMPVSEACDTFSYGVVSIQLLISWPSPKAGDVFKYKNTMAGGGFVEMVIQYILGRLTQSTAHCHRRREQNMHVLLLPQ